MGTNSSSTTLQCVILTNMTVTLSELPFLMASLAILLHAVSNRKETGSIGSLSGVPGDAEKPNGVNGRQTTIRFYY